MSVNDTESATSTGFGVTDTFLQEASPQLKNPRIMSMGVRVKTGDDTEEDGNRGRRIPTDAFPF